MSTEITTAFVSQVRDNVFHLAQQQGSRLRKAVIVENVVGKEAFFERIGLVAVQDVISRHQDTPIVNTPHSRRKVSLKDRVVADLIDDLDKVRLLISPQSEYARSFAMAMGRDWDDFIIAALTGNAFGGADGSTTIAFPAGQKIAAGGTGLDIPKLRQTKRKLDEAEVDPGAPRFLVASAKQFDDLLGTTQVTSSDFNTVKALVQGELKTFMGFEFIRSERLNKTGDDRECVAWAMTAMRLAIAKEPVTEIDRRPDKMNSTQVLIKAAHEATRIEEVQVVQIDCDETV